MRNHQLKKGGFRQKHLIVDFEGYRQDEIFIIQEIAICHLELSLFSNFFLKLPKFTKYSTQAYYLAKHHNFISFNYGRVRISIIKKMFNATYAYIIVKDDEKRAILKKFTINPIITFDCPPYRELLIQQPLFTCQFYKHNYCHKCALYKVQKPAVWYKNEQIRAYDTPD